MDGGDWGADNDEDAGNVGDSGLWGTDVEMDNQAWGT